MKKLPLHSMACALFFVTACHNKTSESKKNVTDNIPKPGAVMAMATMPVTNDPLNKFTFSVKVIADSNVASGVYDVDADYGPNFAQGQFTMPKGGERLIPLIRKGSAPYTYIIGFKVAGDTTFYDYFEVTSNRNNTTMQYLKAYTF